MLCPAPHLYPPEVLGREAGPPCSQGTAEAAASPAPINTSQSHPPLLPNDSHSQCSMTQTVLLSEEENQDWGWGVGVGGGTELTGFRAELAFLLQCHQLIRNESPSPFLLHVCVCVCVCCLLYTSPSPRDQLSSRMPSSACACVCVCVCVVCSVV